MFSMSMDPTHIGDGDRKRKRYDSIIGEHRTQLVNHSTTLNSDGADLGLKTSKFANCRRSASIPSQAGLAEIPQT